MDLDEMKRRGDYAARLMAEPLFQEAFATLNAEFMSAWENCTDKEERDRIWFAVRNLKRLYQYFGTVLDDGKVAAAQILAEEEKRKRTRKAA